MLHMFIGFLSALLILGIFLLIHHQAKLQKQHLIYFFIQCTLGSFIIHSYENIWFWLGFLILSYMSLDDFHQTSISLSLPVWLSLCFYFFEGNPYSVLWVVVFFGVFLLIDVLWTKFVSENFDILFLFPLSYLCFFDKNEWLAFFIFLLIVLVARLSKDTFIGEGDAFFALPLLYYLNVDTYLSFFLMSMLIAMPFALYQLKFTKATDFAFTPFLLGGFIVTYANHSTISIYIIVLTTLSSFSLWIFSTLKK